MSPEMSKLVVLAIGAAGLATWLAALAVLVRASRERQNWAQAAAGRFDIEADASGGTIVGEADVEGRPEDLAARLAGLLARDDQGALGPVKVVRCDPDEVAFEAAGLPAPRPGTGFRRGRFRLAPDGSRTRISYAIEASSGRALLGVGWMIQALGLAALAGGLWLEFAYVLPNPNPMIRGQAVQMVQVIHLLWPPFLLAHLSLQPARMVRARVESLVHNLPYR